MLSCGHTFAEIQLTEANYKYDAKTHELEKFGVINKNGYVELSKATINSFVTKIRLTDWLEVGIRSFTPYKKDKDFWIWKVPKTEYKGLHIIGVYRGVCDISGSDKCGWAATTGLIFEETESQVRNKKLILSSENIVSSMQFLGKKRAVINFTPEEI
jgi:hypothetical protein